MAWSIGLNISDSFVEFCASSNDNIHHKVLRSNQYPVPQLFESFLSECSIAVGDIEKTNIYNRFPLNCIKKKLGSAPAFLVTTGFEHWLPLNQPIKQKYLTVSPSRNKSLINTDLVFGISEKVNAHGGIERALEVSELEAIAAKLEMNEVQNIAIGFLNSHKNNVHEKLAENFLTERGFSVYSSYHTPCGDNDEKKRWWHSFLDAYCSGSLKDYNKELLLGLESIGLKGSKISWMGNPQSSPTESGLSYYKDLNTTLKNKKVSQYLFCGFEDVYLGETTQTQDFWRFKNIRMGGEFPLLKPLSIQPTSLLDTSFFGCTNISSKQIGYEPGPMFLGRGMKTCFLDLMAYKGWLPESLSTEVSEKFEKVFEENIWAQSADIRESGDVSTPDIIESLVKTVRDLLYTQLYLEFGFRPIIFVGPLAKTYLKLLADTDLNIKVQETYTTQLLKEGLNA